MLPPDFAQRLLEPATVKVLATADADGTPYLTIDDTLHIGSEGYLVYLNFEEFSHTHRNLVRSLWFSGRVAVHVALAAGRRFQVRGKPWRALVAGPFFERCYREARARKGDVDLSTVWLIAPEECTEETPAVRAERDGTGRLPLLHLDRLARAAELAGAAEDPGRRPPVG